MWCNAGLPWPSFQVLLRVQKLDDVGVWSTIVLPGGRRVLGVNETALEGLTGLELLALVQFHRPVTATLRLPVVRMRTPRCSASGCDDFTVLPGQLAAVKQAIADGLIVPHAQYIARCPLDSGTNASYNAVLQVRSPRATASSCCYMCTVFSQKCAILLGPTLASRTATEWMDGAVARLTNMDIRVLARQHGYEEQKSTSGWLCKLHLGRRDVRIHRAPCWTWLTLAPRIALCSAWHSSGSPARMFVNKCRAFRTLLSTTELASKCSMPTTPQAAGRVTARIVAATTAATMTKAFQHLPRSQV